MKSVASLIIVLTFSALCFAQQVTFIGPKKYDGVIVAEARYIKGNDSRPQNVYSDVPFQKIPDSSSSTQRNTIGTSKQLETVKTADFRNRTQVIIRNNTTKEVKSIEYNFTATWENSEKVFSFVNKTGIKPYKQATLSDTMPGFAVLPRVTAKITRVVFKDGSVWTP